MRNELFHQEVFHPYLHDRKKLLLIGWYTEDGYERTYMFSSETKKDS